MYFSIKNYLKNIRNYITLPNTLLTEQVDQLRWVGTNRNCEKGRDLLGHLFQDKSNTYIFLKNPLSNQVSLGCW